MEESQTSCWSWSNGDEKGDTWQDEKLKYFLCNCNSLTSHIDLSHSSLVGVVRTVRPGICHLGISPLCTCPPGNGSPRSISPSLCPCPWGRGGGRSTSRLCAAGGRHSRRLEFKKTMSEDQITKRAACLPLS